MPEDLNDAQRQAVDAHDGPVLIIAGPGTGKTKTLTARIAWLLEHQSTTQPEIVALTFTNKAAREMRNRLRKLLGRSSGSKPNITTFHALGADLLRRQRKHEQLLSEQRRAEIIRQLAKSPSLKNLSVRELSLMISRAKTSLSDLDQPAMQLLERYEAALASQGVHDFDDLLVKGFELLQAGNAKRLGYTHVLVDELQDTSELQYEMLKLLAGGANIFAIGDPNQSIYSFRGAGAEMFECFRKDFPATREIALTVNYRSRPEITRLANAVFPNAPRLVPASEGSGRVCTVQTLNEYSAAAYILREIEQGIGGSDMLKASGDHDVREPRDYAVLYRTHRAARALQRAFGEAGVPYQTAGEGSPYEQPEVQAVIACMRYALLPSDVAKAELVKFSLLRCPSLTQIEALLVKFPKPHDQSVCDFAGGIAGLLGFERPEQHQNIRQFLGSLVQFGPCAGGLEKSLEHIDKISESEFFDPSVNAVTLLTIHAAKGLEFTRVFLIAAEEGILPKHSKESAADVDEERRLFYVAVTRAKETLDIMHAKTRAGAPGKLSRFVAEIPGGLLPRTVDPDMASLETRAAKRRLRRAQASLF